ncbi:hypothetical protein [Dorea formicigenerans]|uniref:Uncharacterized protein n=1 Tax=Dorea formicigenerans TaxID=39486 RepID=A0A3E5GQ18_9FIRM|nr:hypothetical protein [Dorea formicigenerans]RGO47664.1 hypothetical protein DXB12_13945 [Dorea formicigenerans]
MLKFITCFKIRKKVKMLGGGDVLDILVFITTMCEAAAEKISKEKNMDYEDAIKFVVDSIEEGCNLLKE